MRRIFTMLDSGGVKVVRSGEGRSQKSEARGKKQEVRSQKQEVRSKVSDG